MSKSNRRIGVVINYGSLLMFLAFFYYGKFGEWNIISTTGSGLSTIIFFASLIIVYFKTGLWRLVHTKVEKLDERQLLVTYESLRYSYSIFSVLCLLIVISAEIISDYILIGVDVPLMPIFWVLFLLAHTLPASIIAWTEKEV